MQFGSLVTGVCQVKHVFLLLRVEHQRVLVSLLHREQQLRNQLFRARLSRCRSGCQLVVVLLQLRLQNHERLLQVFLLQHGACLYCKPYYDNEQK